MQHDFYKKKKKKFHYRKNHNEKKNCRGLMDYVDDGVGWSKCSASDFSNFITDDGKKTPCLKR